LGKYARVSSGTEKEREEGKKKKGSPTQNPSYFSHTHTV